MELDGRGCFPALSNESKARNVLTEEAQNFALLGVTAYGIFGKDEIAVKMNIKNAGCAGNESQFLDDVLVVID